MASRKMKVCIFSPYLPHSVGGGEKYLLDVALALSANHCVSIAINADFLAKATSESDQLAQIKKQYEGFLNQSLSSIKFITTPLASQANFFQKLWWTKQFDVLYYATDGSLFFSLAKKNILHVQVPLKLDKSGWLEQKKLANWQVKNTNSYFTKSIIEPSWPVKVDLVHQPMVNVDKLHPKNLAKKEKIIVNVGRFFSHLHSKRQDILVKIFKRLRTKLKTELKGWQLVLLGNVEEQAYAAQVKQLAQGAPIKILHQVARSDLETWLQRASIYWHATGYRVNPKKEPEKVEHFGISTVEAMAAGCVPIVIGKGGQLEVVGPELQKWTWLSQLDCLKTTAQVIRNSSLREKLQLKAIEQSKQFGPAIFKHKLEQMLQ